MIIARSLVSLFVLFRFFEFALVVGVPRFRDNDIRKAMSFVRSNNDFRNIYPTYPIICLIIFFWYNVKYDIAEIGKNVITSLPYHYDIYTESSANELHSNFVM